MLFYLKKAKINIEKLFEIEKISTVFNLKKKVYGKNIVIDDSTFKHFFENIN